MFGARRNPATPLDRRDELVPNYYLDWAFREMQGIVAKLPDERAGAQLHRAHRARPQHPARGRDRRSRSQLRQFGHDYNATPGGDGDHGAERRRARHGRRARLRREPVQPRGRRHAPARLLVQALCVSHRAHERLQAELGVPRRPALHRQLVPAQLFRRLRRPGHHAQRDHALAQHGGGARGRGGRPRQDHRQHAQDGRHQPDHQSRGRCRWARPTSPCSSTRAPTRISPAAA